MGPRKYRHRERGCLRGYYYQYYSLLGRRPSPSVRLTLILVPVVLLFLVLALLLRARLPSVADKPKSVSFKTRFRDMMHDMERRLDGEIMANSFREEFTDMMCSEAKRQLVATPRALATYALAAQSVSKPNAPMAPEAPWFAFRTTSPLDTKTHVGMIEYSGLRIYPALMKTASKLTPTQAVTIVAHLTVDRLNRLETFIRRLDASTTRVSAAIFVPKYLLDEGWSNIGTAATR